MTFITTIFSAIGITSITLIALYALGNVILPLFNIHVAIRIKFYKAKKAL